jgi:hypothetical protein
MMYLLINGPPAVLAHFDLRVNARFVNDCQTALRDIPDAHTMLQPLLATIRITPLPTKQSTASETSGF